MSPPPRSASRQGALRRQPLPRRERAGLSQKDAAARAALTRARLDKIEGGEALPSFEILIRLAGAYSITVGELVEGVAWKPGWVEDSGPAEYRVSD